MGWRCLIKSEALNLLEEEFVFFSLSPMNIIFLNCKGALNPHFHSVLSDLLNRHSLAIVVVMEKRVGGERAKAITDRLPFDGAFHADTIGYSRGIWVLWKSCSWPRLNRRYMSQLRYLTLTFPWFYPPFMLVLD